MAYFTSFTDPISGAQKQAEIINGQGFVDGQRITDFYSSKGFNVNWNPTDKPVEGGAFGTYSFTKSQQPSSQAIKPPAAQQQPTGMSYFPNAPTQVNTPYAQEMNSVIKKLGTWQPRSQDQLMGQAQLFANLQIDPQVSALDQLLSTANTNAENARQRVNANYSGIQSQATGLLEQAEEDALRAAVKRGGGQSGAVNWETAQYKKPIMQAVMQAEAQKTADLNAIDNTLANTESQVASSLQGLEAQRGNIVAAQLFALQQYEDARESGNVEQMVQAANTFGGLQNQRAQIEGSLSLGYMPYYAEPIEATRNRDLSYEQTYGGPPPGSFKDQGSVGLRSYLSNSGINVDWDPKTQDVIIGGKRYSPSVLQSQGGQLVDGAWYLPESAVRSFLS